MLSDMIFRIIRNGKARIGELGVSVPLGLCFIFFFLLDLHGNADVLFLLFLFVFILFYFFLPYPDVVYKISQDP